MNTTHRICLNMIVKNETRVLGRLFDSVKDIISYYVIVDTGSTDGTPTFIKEWMDNVGIQGEVHIQPWVNFGYNRQQALEYAYQSNQADWVLLIDADEELGICNPEFYKNLKLGISYCLEKKHNDIRYRLKNLLNIHNEQWKWQGVVHEYIELIDGNGTCENLNDAWIIYHQGEGARSFGVSDKQKYVNDAYLLEAELKKNPDDTRNRFYLAQSYRDAGNLNDAYDNYVLRANTTGWIDENFVAQYNAGKIAICLDKSYQDISNLLLMAYEMLPTRGAEPMYQLALYCRGKEWFNQAYMFAKIGSQIPYPSDALFVETDVYEWKIFDELAISAYWIGQYQECKEVCEKLLTLSLGGDHIKRINENLQFALQKLKVPSATVKNFNLPLIDCSNASTLKQEISELTAILNPSRLTEIVDIGANLIDGNTPYDPMLTVGACHITGFEPQEQPLAKLIQEKSIYESYLPYAIGDGADHMLNVCIASGMTSLLEPDETALALFDILQPLAEVTATLPIKTQRLDDIEEIKHLDFLKIDIQGGELSVFKNSKQKLSQAVIIQTEISFITLYKNQPSFGDIDIELRQQGFVPHCLAELKRWPITPYVDEANPRQAVNQLLEADIVYIRDLTKPELISDEQLKQLSLIAHSCYRSFDLVSHCIMLLEKRHVIDAGSLKNYQLMIKG